LKTTSPQRWIVGLATGLCCLACPAEVPAQGTAAPPSLEEVAALVRQASLEANANKRRAATQTLAKALQAADRLAAGTAADGLRENIGEVAYQIHDYETADRAWEAVHAYRQKKLPPTDLTLLRVRSRLAVVKENLGCFRQAHVLHEQVYRVLLRTRREDSRLVQMVRLDLARSLWRRGDLIAAMTLVARAYEIQRDLSPNHKVSQQALHYLAFIKSELGQLREAEMLLQQLVEVRQKIHDLDPLLQSARVTLAGTRFELGKYPEALADYEQAHRALVRMHSANDPRALEARVGIAICRHNLADLTAAQKIFQEVAEQLRPLPEFHPQRQSLRLRQLYLHARLGQGQAAAAQATALVRGTRMDFTRTLSPRQLGAKAQEAAPVVDALVSLAVGVGTLPPQTGVVESAFLLSETLRGLEIRAARRTRHLASEGKDDDARQLAAQLQEAVHRVAEIARTGGDKAQQDQARFTDAVLDRDGIFERLSRLVTAASTFDAAAVTAATLAARLPEGTAAVAIVGYHQATLDSKDPKRDQLQARLAAFILERGGKVTLKPLGARQQILERVAAIRAVGGAGQVRGRRPGSGDGEGTGKSTSKSETAVGAELCSQVLDPILAALPGIRAVYVSLDESLQLLPLDALSTKGGGLLGDKLEVLPVVSLFELLEASPAKTATPPQMLVVGGVDYGNGGKDAAWQPLPKTGEEATAVRDRFLLTFPSGGAQLLQAKQARKADLVLAARKIHYLHIATHGYFAPETLRSSRDALVGRHLSPLSVRGLSPLVLTGLVLSDGNAEDGSGLLTAEEMQSLDLACCQLVVLSACNTSLGIQRAGQGYASLRAALQGAGARYVLTSLWKVGDDNTRKLMVDFYRRMWQEKQSPRKALWAAKMKARKDGMPFRDWAGWVLTGN